MNGLRLRVVVAVLAVALLTAACGSEAYYPDTLAQEAAPAASNAEPEPRPDAKGDPTPGGVEPAPAAEGRTGQTQAPAAQPALGPTATPESLVEDLEPIPTATPLPTPVGQPTATPPPTPTPFRPLPLTPPKPTPVPDVLRPPTAPLLLPRTISGLDFPVRGGCLRTVFAADANFTQTIEFHFEDTSKLLGGLPVELEILQDVIVVLLVGENLDQHCNLGPYVEPTIQTESIASEGILVVTADRALDNDDFESGPVRVTIEATNVIFHTSLGEHTLDRLVIDGQLNYLGDEDE